MTGSPVCPWRLFSPSNDIRLSQNIRLCGFIFGNGDIALTKALIVGREMVSLEPAAHRSAGTGLGGRPRLPFLHLVPTNPAAKSHLGRLIRCRPAGHPPSASAFMSRASHQPVDLLVLTTATMHDMARYGCPGLHRPANLLRHLEAATKPAVFRSLDASFSTVLQTESVSTPGEHVTTEPSIIPPSSPTPPERVMPPTCTEESRWPSPCGSWRSSR